MKKYLLFGLLVVALILIIGKFTLRHKAAIGAGVDDDMEADSGPLGPAPDVSFKSLDGSSVSLSSLRGKVVFVNFWATWCEPCQMELPWLVEFQKKYADKGFTIVGVAMDDDGASAVGPWVSKQKFDVGGQQLAIDYPIFLGDDDLGAKFGGVLGLPTSFLITRDGKIATRVVGVVSREHLETVIQHAL